ncbi:hypothetical protein BH10CYA1_BH10CYA1_53710 [soil metagenome]
MSNNIYIGVAIILFGCTLAALALHWVSNPLFQRLQTKRMYALFGRLYKLWQPVNEQARKVLELWDAASNFNYRATGSPLVSPQAESLRALLEAGINYKKEKLALKQLAKIEAEITIVASLARSQWTTYGVTPHFLWVGELDCYYETGTEGIYWSLEEPLKGYEGLHILENGDELTVFDSDYSTLWQGVVDLEYSTGEAYPENPEYGKRVIFGYWVHGTQRGMDPEKWAGMFFPQDESKLLQANLRRQLFFDDNGQVE